MNKNRFFVPLTIGLMIFTLFGFGVHKVNASLPLPSDTIFRIEANLGDMLMVHIDETINGSPRARNIGLNITTLQSQSNLAVLNMTQVKWNTTHGFYEDPEMGVRYVMNSTPHYWTISPLGSEGWLIYYASIIIPVNISTGIVDLPFWANVMADPIAQTSYGNGLQLNQQKVVGSEIQLYNTTTGYYCNMTYFTNGTLQSAKVSLNVSYPGGWFLLMQNYTRVWDQNLLNPIYNLHFDTPSNRAMVFRNNMDGSLQGYNAYSGFIEYNMETNYQGDNTVFRVVNASNVYSLQGVWQLTATDYTMGGANNFYGNAMGIVDGINLIYKPGTTGQELNQSYYPQVVSYMKFFDSSTVGPYWVRFDNSSNNYYLYLEVLPNGRLQNFTAWWDMSSSGTPHFQEQINIGDPLDTTNFLAPFPIDLIYDVHDNSSGVVGYEKYAALTQYLDLSQASWNINATHYLWNEVTRIWDLNETSVQIAGSFDEGNSLLMMIESMNIIWPVGTNGDDLNLTWGPVFLGMFGFDQSFVTSNSCRYVNSSTGYNVYIEVSANGLIANMTFFFSPEGDQDINGSYIYIPQTITPPTIAVLSATTSNGVVGLTWNAVPNAANYTVYRYSSPITSINGSVTVLGTTSSLAFGDTVSGETDYYYAVISNQQMQYQMILSSSVSNTVKVTADFPGPQAPVLDAVTPNPSNGTVTLSWRASAGASYYLVYRYSGLITEVNSSISLIGNVTTTTLTQANVPSGTYYYVVVAVNATGQTFSNCVSVVVSTSTTGTTPPGGIDGFPIFMVGLIAICTLVVLKRRIRRV